MYNNIDTKFNNYFYIIFKYILYKIIQTAILNFRQITREAYLWKLKYEILQLKISHQKFKIFLNRPFINFRLNFYYKVMKIFSFFKL